MRIEVTQEDIKKGIKENPKCCAVALAVQRAFNDKTCSVGAHYVHIERKGKHVKSFDQPKEVSQFIADFDAGRKVQPFSFDLPIDP